MLPSLCRICGESVLLEKMLIALCVDNVSTRQIKCPIVRKMQHELKWILGEQSTACARNIQKGIPVFFGTIKFQDARRRETKNVNHFRVQVSFILPSLYSADGFDKVPH